MDTYDFDDIIEAIKEEAMEEIRIKAKTIAISTKERADDLATADLNVKIAPYYTENVTYTELDRETHEIKVAKTALKIEDGFDRHFMEYLLKDAATGTQYDKRVIPLFNNVPKGQPRSLTVDSTRMASLINDLKKIYAAQKGKVKLGKNSSPRVGVQKIKHPQYVPQGKPERFSTISKEHKGTGKWEYPAKPGKKYIDIALEEVMNEMNNLKD